MSNDKNKIIPNEFIVFKLSSSKSPSEVTLRSAEWAVITQVDGHKSVAEIAEILALTKTEAINLCKGLYQKELIEIKAWGEQREDYVPLSFFNILAEELTRIIGPVAPFIIDDVLIETGSQKDRYLLTKVAELVEMISEEIPDEQKKVKFQQIMLSHLKGMKIK